MFSVIVPAYNRQDYLDESLASVLAQSRDDWECIVIDDASPDVVLSVPNDPRFRSVRNPRNLGIPGSRNVGLSLARGDRICFLDHDDRYTPDRLDRGDNAAAAVVVILPAHQACLRGMVANHILNGFTPHLGQVTVARKACLAFDESFRVADDVDWWLRLALAHAFVAVEADCYQFREHPWSTATGREARIADSFLLLEKHAAYFRSHRRARAFRWARIAALSSSRKHSAVALARSISACPSRYALGRAKDLLQR